MSKKNRRRARAPTYQRITHRSSIRFIPSSRSTNRQQLFSKIIMSKIFSVPSFPTLTFSPSPSRCFCVQRLCLSWSLLVGRTDVLSRHLQLHLSHLIYHRVMHTHTHTWIAALCVCPCVRACERVHYVPKRVNMI